VGNLEKKGRGGGPPNVPNGYTEEGETSHQEAPEVYGITTTH